MNEQTAKLSAMKEYFRGVRSEWGKINWPQRRQVVAETIFVVGIVTVFTISVYFIDVILKALFGLLK